MRCNDFIRNVGGDDNDCTNEVVHNDDGGDDSAKDTDKKNCCYLITYAYFLYKHWEDTRWP